MPLIQVAGIKLAVDLKQTAASSIPQMCIRQAEILCLRWNPLRVIILTATMNCMEFTVFFMLIKNQQGTMGIVDMVILLIMCKTRKHMAIKSPKRIVYMVY